MNPVSYSPFLRALVIAVEHEIGVKAAAKAQGLPPSAVFTLTAAPEAGPGFNPLPGQEVKVPKIDLDGWPLGGVRFPEAVVPIGRPQPVALAPVTTASIDATCGNLGGWAQWDDGKQARYYGSPKSYAERYGRQVSALAAEGYLLADEAAAMKPPAMSWGGF